MKRLSFSLSIAFILLVCSQINSQVDTQRTYIFGHSLIVHDPPSIPTPSNETTVPHWVHLLSESANKNYEVAGQYGFLPQHANLPPMSQWGFDLVEPAWESDVETFAEAGFTDILLTAGNFIQYQPADLPFETEDGSGTISPLSASLDIVDWTFMQQSDLRFYVYENWPDMATFVAGELFPPSPSEFTIYNDYTLNGFHDWWIDYHDHLLSDRPAQNIKMIPVGPIISRLLTETPLSAIPILDLYEDNAPHGRPTIYFLAGLVTYMAMYEEMAPLNYQVPTIVHSLVEQNYLSTVNFIWEALLDFNTPNGDSRVFFNNEISNLTDLWVDDHSISLFPNPTTGFFQIKGAVENFNVDIIDVNGQVYQALDSSADIIIDIATLPAGMYFVRVENMNNGVVRVERIVKYD